MSRPRAFSLVPAAVLCCAGCGEPAPPIRIGLLPYLTGVRIEFSGQGTMDAAAMAVSEINATGGLLVAGQRHLVELRIRDAGEQVDFATAAARALINHDSVVALIGPQFSRDALAVAMLAEGDHIPMITPMASLPEVTRNRPFVFRMAFTDDEQGASLSRFAREDLRAQRAAVLYDVADDYARGLAETFQLGFLAGGGVIVASETFTTDAPSYRDQLGRIAATRPEVLFLPSYMPLVQGQMEQARAAGIEAVFLGTDVWDGNVLSRIPVAEGAYQTAQWWPDTTVAAIANFMTRFQDRYGRRPAGTEAATWDAVRLLAAAIQAAGATEGTALQAALAATSGFQGVTGEISFDPDGNPTKSAVLLRLGPGGPVRIGPPGR